MHHHGLRHIMTFALLVLAPMLAAANKPLVYIAGVPVVTKESQVLATEEGFLPASLNTNAIRRTLESREYIHIQPHNPVRGPEDAAVTVIEFMDLSCIYCQEMSKKIDALRTAYPGHIRHVYVHLPFDPYNTTNPAAFYGRIADDNDLFWVYRQKLYDVSGNDDRLFVEKLLESGIPERQVRQNARRHARKYYRQLDTDTILSKELGLTKPPHLYVNGILMGRSIPMSALDDFIAYEIKQYERKQ